MRVIPDADTNAERSDKQKEENSKFGKLSFMLNSIYEYVKLGFPRAYQPLNTAIKFNLPFVEKVDNQIVFDYSKLIFSKGDLERMSISRIFINSQSGVNKHYIRLVYNNIGVGKRTYNQKSVFIVVMQGGDVIIVSHGTIRSYGNDQQRRVSSPYVDAYKGKIADCYLFFYEGKQCTDTLFAGSIFLNW